MKAIVTEIFQDKFNGQHYFVGQTVDFDESRVNELVKRNLVKVAEKPKKSTKIKGGVEECLKK